MFVKNNYEKYLKSANKVHPRSYKMKQRQKNVLHLNNIRKKIHYLSTKQKGQTLDVYYYQGKLHYNNNN